MESRLVALRRIAYATCKKKVGAPFPRVTPENSAKKPADSIDKTAGMISSFSAVDSRGCVLMGFGLFGVIFIIRRLNEHR
jgi:hypothetical protein